jgi:hypothetical protein
MDMFANSSPRESSDPVVTPARRSAFLQAIPWLHAAFFGLGGIWAVLSRRTFEAVTGPKVDYWLVRTVGGLLTVVGVVIGLAQLRGRLTPEIRWLAMGTSGVLTAIDVVFVAKRRVRPVYLLDAITNLVLIAGWLNRQDPAPSALDSAARAKTIQSHVA